MLMIIQEEHTILSPMIPMDCKFELAAQQRMKRVNDRD